MKKVILGAAIVAAMFGTASAQTTATMSHAVTVPTILAITTNPTDANHAYTLVEGNLLSETGLNFTQFIVRANVRWQLGTTYSVTGPTTAGTNAFRNHLKFSSDGGINWLSLPDNGSTTVNPLPGFDNMNPTAAGGYVLNVNAKLTAMNYDVPPGTYTATTLMTLSAE